MYISRLFTKSDTMPPKVGQVGLADVGITTA